MSKEMVPFELPITFTVSPKHPEIDRDGFVRYVTRLGDMTHDDIKNIISGIVNGETRGFVGGMTIQEIFNDKAAFNDHVIQRVKPDLDQYGLGIDNANIEELRDTKGNSYFENLKQKALEGALTISRIEVSEARKTGDIGEKQREVITRQERSVLEAKAKEVETTQNQKMSDYSRLLTITNTTNLQQEELAKIEAHQATETRRIQVESELNKRKQEQELEHLRSQQVVQATAKAEALIKDVETEAATVKIRAEAEAAAIRIRADAKFFEESRKADGVKALLEATAQGLDKIYNVSQTNPELANFYLALEKGLFNSDGLFSVVADKQALAIRDMKPNINVWSTGPGTGDYTNVLTGLAKSVPPILDVIQQQTNIKLPDFMRPGKVSADVKSGFE